MLPSHDTEDSEETKGDYEADRAYPGLHRRADRHRLVLKGKRYCVAGRVGASRGMGVVLKALPRAPAKAILLQSRYWR